MVRGPFEALVFDVGGVLVAHENRLIHERLATHCTARPSAADIAALLAEPKWDRGEAPISELHAQLRRDLGYAGDWDAFHADWCCHFTLDSAMLAVVHDLARDHRVILFSNTNAIHWDYLERQTTIGAFERFLSHEIGMKKPDLAAFVHVAEKAAVEPSRALFLDDLAENVEGARRAGFQAEVFLGRSWLEDVLARAGVRWRRGADP